MRNWRSAISAHLSSVPVGAISSKAHEVANAISTRATDVGERIGNMLPGQVVIAEDDLRDVLDVLEESRDEAALQARFLLEVALGDADEHLELMEDLDGDGEISYDEWKEAQGLESAQDRRARRRVERAERRAGMKSSQVEDSDEVPEKVRAGSAGNETLDAGGDASVEDGDSKV